LQDSQLSNFSNKDELISDLQSLLFNLENILNDMKEMIKVPFEKGLTNEKISEITSTQLIHQNFNLDKATEIYNDAKTQFESLVGERDNTKINYDTNKIQFNFFFILSLVLIIILILYLKGYNIFDNYYIYLLFIVLFYLYYDIIKQIINYIFNIVIYFVNIIKSFIRLFS
jgi:hypothetical protein